MAVDGRSPATSRRFRCATSMRRLANRRCSRSATEPESPGCLVEQAVNAALNQAFDEAKRCCCRAWADVTLATLSADFQKRLGGRSNRHRLEIAHAT